MLERLFGSPKDNIGDLNSKLSAVAKKQSNDAFIRECMDRGLDPEQTTWEKLVEFDARRFNERSKKIRENI